MYSIDSVSFDKLYEKFVKKKVKMKSYLGQSNSTA